MCKWIGCRTLKPNSFNQMPKKYLQLNKASSTMLSLTSLITRTPWLKVLGLCLALGSALAQPQTSVNAPPPSSSSVNPAAVSSQAAQWPAQPVKIIVPFTPGTGMDSIARAVQPKLSERLGQPVIVQNMPGASGNIGAEYVARANADGLTLLMGANTMLMASQMYKSAAYHPLRDFAPVTMAAYGTLMLVSNPKSGIKSINDLVTLSKSKPGFVTFGSPGVGTPHHMAMELFKSEANLFMLHVPYKGSAGFIQDLLSAEVMTGFLPVHIAQSFVNSGQLNALAVGSVKRHPVAPNVPTFIEQGFQNIDLDLWYGFFYPVKTPPALIERMNKELSAVLLTTQVREMLGKSGLDATASSPKELAKIAVRDYEQWGKLIKAKGIVFE